MANNDDLHLATGRDFRLAIDTEGACRRYGDERVQVLWHFLQEQDEIPAIGIVEKGDGRNQQGFHRSRTTYEGRGCPRDFSVEEAPHTAAQAQGAPNRCLTQVDNGIQREMQLKDRSDHRERTQRGGLPLTEVAREPGERDALVRGDIEGAIAGAIPAVVAEPASEAGVEYAERRILRDMSNSDATPWVDMRVERAQLGTPS